MVAGVQPASFPGGEKILRLVPLHRTRERLTPSLDETLRTAQQKFIKRNNFLVRKSTEQRMSKKMSTAMQQQLIPMKTELSEMADVVSYVKHSLESVKSKSKQNAGNLVKLKQLWDYHFNEQPSSSQQEGGLKVDPFDPLHHLLFRRVNDLEKLHPLVLSLQDEVKSLQQQMKHRDEQLAATRQHHPAATPDRDSTVPDKKHQRETGRKKPNKDLDLSEGLRRLRLPLDRWREEWRSTRGRQRELSLVYTSNRNSAPKPLPPLHLK